jgi:glycosyltransferase involved in cell wall biosynthesis
MQKVLILANNMGGLYKFRRELLEALLERGQEVYISVPDGNFRTPLEEMGCHFILTPIDRRGTDPVADLKLMLRYRRLIRSLEPGVVLTYTIKPNIYGGLVCRYLRQPYIANITGMGSAINQGGMFTRFILSLFKIALSGAACVFFQNEMNRSFFVEKGLVGDKHRMIPGSGVNLAEHRLEEYPEGEDLNFLFMGRVMQDKGVDELFAAAQTIRAKYPGTSFHILGSCEERYQERLRDLEQRQVISYHGFQQNVHGYLKACHAVVMPSYHEGMSNVLLEAAATGRPVLASAIPGCQEAFDEGVSGLGFAPQDTKALIAALERFIALPQAARREMGLQGRAKVERQFDRQQVIASYLQEIDRIS